jgi:hypothetical protein
MQKKTHWIGLLVMGAFLISGCELALLGVGAIGAGSGTYLYLSGEMKMERLPKDRRGYAWLGCPAGKGDRQWKDLGCHQ